MYGPSGQRLGFTPTVARVGDLAEIGRQLEGITDRSSMALLHGGAGTSSHTRVNSDEEETLRDDQQSDSLSSSEQVGRPSALFSLV